MLYDPRLAFMGRMELSDGYWPLSRLGVGVCLGLVLTSLIAVRAAEETDPSGLRPPAWYEDSELGEKWNQLTGRYIFERSCTSCHKWGPDHWSRPDWETYLEGFPGNHEPDVAKAYSDLTAMFQPVKMVPNAAQRTSTLREFLLASAPDSTPPESERIAPYESLPKVGDSAPDFEIVDTEGHRHRVSEYKGKEQLVLVFSRAHW
jgi:hypothetical protein